MKRSKVLETIAAAVILFAGTSLAQTVYPLQGQGPEQMEADIAACRSATGSGAAPTRGSRGGGVARGAAMGAARGAAQAERQGEEHKAWEYAPDEAKDEYKKEQAQEGARAGAAKGAMRQTMRRARQQQQAATADQTYRNCLIGRGYGVQ